MSPRPDGCPGRGGTAPYLTADVLAAVPGMFRWACRDAVCSCHAECVLLCQTHRHAPCRYELNTQVRSRGPCPKSSTLPAAARGLAGQQCTALFCSARRVRCQAVARPGVSHPALPPTSGRPLSISFSNPPTHSHAGQGKGPVCVFTYTCTPTHARMIRPPPFRPPPPHRPPTTHSSLTQLAETQGCHARRVAPHFTQPTIGWVRGAGCAQPDATIPGWHRCTVGRGRVGAILEGGISIGPAAGVPLPGAFCSYVLC